MNSVTMEQIARRFLPAVLTCFLISTVCSEVQRSCHLTTDPVTMETVRAVSMVTTSDWKATDLCSCRLSTPYDSVYITFDLLTPSGQGSDAICGPYLIVEPVPSSFYHVCPRSRRSLGPQSATVSNQSNLIVAFWTRDLERPLQRANITFHSSIPVTLTCQQVVNSSLTLESLDCPCDMRNVGSSPTTGQSDFDLSTRLMRGLVASFSFLVVCGLLLLFFCFNKRYHVLERLKTKMTLCGAEAAKSLTHRGSSNPAFDASNIYDDLPSTANAQPINDLNDEQIREMPKMSENPNKGPWMARASKSNEYITNGIYEEIAYSKRDVSSAALDETNSLSPYATFSECRDSRVRAHLVGKGALSAGDICRWNYKPPSANSVLETKVKTPPKRLRTEPEVEVIYGTVNKSKMNAGNGIPAESSASRKDGLASSALGQLDNDTFV